jgi:predicted nuclease with TOPRIM domain
MGYKYTKFNDLEIEYKRLMGRKSTLNKMITKRSMKIIDLQKQITELKNQIEPFELELTKLSSRIKELSINEKWEPPIVINKTKNIKGYYYYRGKIRFGKKEKLKMIPRDVEIKISKEVRRKNYSDEEFKSVLYKKLRLWVLDWWRNEGVLSK